MSWLKQWSRSGDSPIPSLEPSEAYIQGMEAWEKGDLTEAQRLLEKATEGAPNEIRHVGNLGNIYQEQQNLVEALKCHRKASELSPQHPGAFRNQGRVLMALGRFLESARAFEKSLELEPTHAESAMLCAQALASSGDSVRAWIRCEQSIDEGAASPELHTLFVELLLDCNEAGRAAEASLLPGVSASILHRLGLGYLRLNRPSSAVEALSRAASLVTEDPSLFFHLAIAQKNDGDKDASLRSFTRAAELAPEDPVCRANLGWLQLQTGQTETAFQSMQHAAQLEARLHAPEEELSRVPVHRIRHDAEQLRHILDQTSLSSQAQGYADSLLALEASLDEDDAVVNLMAPDLTRVREGWSLNHYLPECPAIETGALHPHLDLEKIQSDYHESQPKMVIVDNLLCPAALQALQAYCREATIWKRSYENGYVGAFMRSGLASPLLIQLSEDLRLALPRIFKDHRLEQCWAFKCDSGMKGVNLHADVAAINVNFWIGPDEGNENLAQGGLLVWDQESPADWSFDEYNANQSRMRHFLEQSEAQAIQVPHRCNRALVFNSTLFHETDQIQFRPDYVNRRINITLLYGIRLLES